MKKLIFTFHFSLFTFISIAQSYQYYQWQGFNPGIFCNDSTPSICQVLNFEVDTLRDVLWIFGDFEGADTTNSPYIVGYQDNQFLSFPGLGQGLAHSNDYLFYQGNLIGCSGGGVFSYNLDSQQATIIGTFPTSINDGGLCLVEYNGDLYVGGQFYAIKGPTGGWVPAQGIARWDGTNWNALGIGLSYAGTPDVNDMVVYQNKLFAGGLFTIGADTAWNIAQWDGTNWNNLWTGTGGYGTNNTSGGHWGAEVKDMEIFQNKLYIIGDFDSICGIPSHLAYWDGINWTGTNYPNLFGKKLKNFKDTYLAIHHYDQFIHFWNNSQDVIVDPSGITNALNTIETFHDTLFAGGVLNNSVLPFRLARLVYDSTGTGIVINEIKNGEDEIRVFPNPANETVTITAENIKEIIVSNLLGEKMMRLLRDYPLNDISIDMSSLPAGVYFLKVQMSDGSIKAQKFVKH